MRTITTHQSATDDTVSVIAIGPNSYEINTSEREDFPGGGATVIHRTLTIEFKCAGNPAGVTMESLIAVLVDRLEGMQATPFRSVENDDALMGLDIAMQSLHARTLRRTLEGKAGTQTP